MDFSTRVAALYVEHGTRHILPYVGRSYEDGASGVFRLALIGLNSYISDGDWPNDDDDLRRWYRGWWAAAGHGRSHRFYAGVFREGDALAHKLTSSSLLFKGLRYEGDPRRRRSSTGRTR